MEIIATRKFTVFERGCLAGKDRGNSGSRGPPAFEKDVPTMRLREMNTANASRCVRGQEDSAETAAGLNKTLASSAFFEWC